MEIPADEAVKEEMQMKLLPDGRRKAPVARASKSAKKSAFPPEPVPVDNMMMKNKKSESQPI